MRASDALGRYGEQVAVAHLVRVGLTVLDRNWRCRLGEIDVVAADGAVLVVVEVKTRSSTRFGSPTEAITAAKAARLRRLAAAWLEQHPGSSFVAVRFDAVAVLSSPGGPSVDHLPGAW